MVVVVVVVVVVGADVVDGAPEVVLSARRPPSGSSVVTEVGGVTASASAPSPAQADSSRHTAVAAIRALVTPSRYIRCADSQKVNRSPSMTRRATKFFAMAIDWDQAVKVASRMDR